MRKRVDYTFISANEHLFAKRGLDRTEIEPSEISLTVKEPGGGGRK